MVKYAIKFTHQALKDQTKIKKSQTLSVKVRKLLDIIAENPYSPIPPYEKLVGDLRGFYSRRINKQHRLVYEVNEEKKFVKILSMWSHYENL